MSILRENPLTNEWTLFAQNRGKRPHDFAQNVKPHNDSEKECPFCKANNKITNQIVYTDKQDWNICVVPNLYPIVMDNIDENLGEKIEIEEELFYRTKDGVGNHEVLVDTSDHEKTVDKFTKDEILDLFKSFDNRYNVLKNQHDAQYVQIFKNNGPSAGMSIKHSHWQIVSLPIIPQRQVIMSDKMEENNCMLCKILEYEKEKGVRIIKESEFFIAIAPYASRLAYEIWIVPKRHFAHFDERTKEENEDLSAMTQFVLRKLVKVKQDLAYNICFMEGGLGSNNFHWHMEILPRMEGFAGFELSTNSYINSVLPEEVKKIFDEFE